MPIEAARARPWAAVVGLSVDQLVAWGVLYYSGSVLSVPIARDLGVTTSAVAAAFSGSLLVSALLTRRIGPVLDRLGALPVLLSGAVIAPVAFAALASTEWDFALLAVFAGLGLAQALCLYEPAFHAVVDWFPAPRQRSRALLVLTSVAGFASTVFLPLTAVLLETLEWRATVLVLAMVTAVVLLPIRFLLRGTPARARIPAQSVAPVPAWGSASTGLLSGAFALQAFAATGAMFSLVWLLVERGQPLEVAAGLTGLAGAAQVPGRLLLSPLSAALRSELRLPLLFIVQAVALAGTALLSGPSLVVSVTAFGAAAGVMTLERAAAALEGFGTEGFGAGSAELASATTLARAGAPFAAAALNESFGSTAGLGVLSACSLAGAAVVGLATRFFRGWTIRCVQSRRTASSS